MTFEPEQELSTEEVEARVDETIANEDVALFMKGTELMPQCGYSRKALGLIQRHHEDVEVVNTLDALDDYRAALAEHSGRETIPQAFVDGEFVGGSDILERLEEKGDLESTLRA